MPGKARFGRDRNKVKFSTRVPGGQNTRLVVAKATGKKGQVSWPHPVSMDSCLYFLKRTLGDKLSKFVPDHAGALCEHQEAATAEEGVVAAEDAVEERWDAAVLSALEQTAPASRGASSSRADQSSPRPKSARTSSSSGAIANSEAATTDALSDANLLALKLEPIMEVYARRGEDQYEDLQEAYTADWTGAAVLGEGNYGKVCVGTKGHATGVHRDECQGAFAINAAGREG